MSVSVLLLRTSSRLFHILGPCILKEHSAKVLHLTKGTTSRLVSNADLRPGLPGLWTTDRFWRYSRALPIMHLLTKVSILWLILLWIGSQCRAHKHSLALSILIFLGSLWLPDFGPFAFNWCLHWEDQLKWNYNSPNGRSPAPTSGLCMLLGLKWSNELYSL